MKEEEKSFELDEHITKIIQYKLVEVIFDKLLKENEITPGEHRRFIRNCEDEIEKLADEWRVLNGK